MHSVLEAAQKWIYAPPRRRRSGVRRRHSQNKASHQDSLFSGFLFASRENFGFSNSIFENMPWILSMSPNNNSAKKKKGKIYRESILSLFLSIIFLGAQDAGDSGFFPCVLNIRKQQTRKRITIFVILNFPFCFS